MRSVSGVTSGAVGFGCSAVQLSRSGDAAPPSATTRTTTAADDELDLSVHSQAAAGIGSLTETLFGVKPGEPIDLDALQRQAQSAVASKLDSLFDRHDIDTSQEIRLQTDACGKVIVTNNHPQKEQIEKFFEDDPELRNEFVKSQSLAEIVAAAREAVAFQKAYAKNPQAAVAQFGYLFSATSRTSVTFSIRGDHYQTLCQYLGGPSYVFETGGPAAG